MIRATDLATGVCAMPSIQCPSCGASLTAKALPTRPVPCPRCKKPIPVQQASPIAVLPPPERSAPPPLPPVRKPRKVVEDEESTGTPFPWPWVAGIAVAVLSLMVAVAAVVIGMTAMREPQQVNQADKDALRPEVRKGQPKEVEPEPQPMPEPERKTKQDQSKEQPKVELPKVEEKPLDTGTPEGVVTLYAKAPTIEERLPFVLDPERIQPLMVKEYSEGINAADTVKVARTTDLADRPGHRIVTATVIKGGRAWTNYYYVKQVDAIYKLDWEATNGYNPLPLKTFVSVRQKAPARMRVTVKLDNYFNYDYLYAERTHVSVSIRDDYGESGHVYAAKDSPAGKRLLEILSDAKPHRLILEVSQVGPFGRPTSELNSVIGSATIVSESWVAP